MNFFSESHKRECSLTLGKFKVPKSIHLALLYVQREACHATLRDSSIHLMKLGALWIENHGLHSGQKRANGSAEVQR